MRPSVAKLKWTDGDYLGRSLVRFLTYLDDEVKAGRLRPMTQDERQTDKLLNPGAP